MKNVALIHTSWLKPFAEYFAARSIDLQPYYGAVSMEAGQVTSGNAWVTKHQLYGFLNAIAEGEGMPEVGFVVGETITPDRLADLGEAIADSNSLGEAVGIFCQLINRHVEGNRCWLEEGRKGEIWLCNAKVPMPHADRRIADHAGLMSMINLVRLIEGRDWYPGEVRLMTSRSSAHKAIPGFKATRFSFDHPATSFCFPAQWLLRPIGSTDRTGAGSEERPPGLLREDEDFPNKIALLLQQILGVGGICPTVELMSELCGTSARSLHRRLKEGGTSYKKIVDRVRLETACHRLRETEITIKELAYQLGYSGANNFTRAFKRLTGVTPMHFRRAKTGT